MINKLIYVKPGVYKAQPEWNYNTSKNSNKKLAIYHSVIAQVISDWDKNTYEVKMIFGEGNSFCRSENQSLGEEEIHTTARNMGLNIEQILLDKKGFIVGRKFGI